MKKKIINVITLGCSKNVVDSEQLLAQLENSGYRVEHNSNDPDARVIVINTCGFIGDAKEESVDMILRYVNLKDAGTVDAVYVMGCLSERYGKELGDEIENVDGFYGVNDLSRVVADLGAKYDDTRLHERKVTTLPHYAYLKISEGCNWRCSFCAIPSIRGGHVSKPVEDIVREARALVEKGVREIMLIAQDLTYYGLDIYGRRRLAELLDALCEIEGLEWIRMHYAYPAFFPKEVIEVMKRQPKICRYIDIPIQHISTPVLKSMKRNIDREGTVELLKYFRREIPDISIRTTLIAGYPTETEKDFEELYGFVKDFRFDRLGVFAYCHEEGTPSGDNYEDIIPEEEKQRRVEEIMTLQAGISLENNGKLVGSVQRVIIDRYENGYYVGRTQYDSPEVDQEVFIKSERELETGHFYEVSVVKSDNYDIYAEYGA